MLVAMFSPAVTYQYFTSTTHIHKPLFTNAHDLSC